LCFVIRQLLPPRLDGKITLPECDEGLAWIGILDDEITGVPGKRPILDGPLRPRPDADHFGDINKMVGDGVAAIGARLACLGDDGDEVTEVGVFEHTGKFAGGPEFSAVRPDLLDTFESV
jgi:hypothetical protein